MDNPLITIIGYVILGFSIIVHEVMHGVVAGAMGDTTAEEQGRITLNPLSHIDPVGTILLPVVLYLSQIGNPNPVVFGYAKPVPTDPNRMRNPRLGMALVSAAGPLSNFALAVIFAIPLKLGLVSGVGADVALQAVITNLALGIFNLLPIPPFDGSKVVVSLLPVRLANAILRYEQFGFLLVFIFLYLNLFQVILVPILFWALQLLGLTS